MAASLGSLVVSLGLDAAQFVDGLNKSQYQSKKFLQGVERAAKVAATALAAAGATAAGIAAKMTRDAVEQARAFDRLSQVSGTTAQQFQYLAVGARAAGVEQDKLADIFKDTQDKVGDFLQNGAGPLADFFENVAPKVGVTAEKFRNLSGPQALGLYVSSLEKAGLSQAEMTFYMEAIASDATLLLPLLRDGAAGFKEWGDQALAAGAIMSQETIQAAKDLDSEVRKLLIQFDGWRNFIAGYLLPDLVDLARSTTSLTTNFRDLGVEIGKLFGYSSVGSFFDEIGLAAARAADFVASVAKEMSGLAKIMRGVKEFDWGLVKEGFADTLGPLQTTVQDEFLARQGARVGPPLPAPSGTSPQVRGSRGGGGGKGKDASRVLRDIEDQAERTRQAVANLITNSEVVAAREYALQVEYLDKLFFDFGLDAEIYESAMKSLAKTQVTTGEKGENALRDQAAAWLDAIDPLREYTRNLEQLEKMLSAGLVNDEQAAKLRTMFEDAARELSEMDEFALEAARNIQDHFGDTLYNAMQGNFDDIAGGFKRMVDRMIAEALAANLARSLMGDFGSTGKVGGVLGSVISSFFGGGGAPISASQATTVIAGRATGGPVKAGGLYEVNERRNEILSVNGRDFLMAGAAGRVRPNPVFTKGSQPVSVNMTVVANDVESFRRSEAQVTTRLGMALNRGGRFA